MVLSKKNISRLHVYHHYDIQEEAANQIMCLVSIQSKILQTTRHLLRMRLGSNFSRHQQACAQVVYCACEVVAYT